MLHLAKTYNVFFYDQRGGGRSKSDAREPVTWQTNVADLHAVIQEFSLGPPSLVGYSFGGMLTLLYTIAAVRDNTYAKPARLALIDPAPVTKEFRLKFEHEFAARQNGMQIRQLREELAASDLRQRDPEAYRQRTFELAVAPYFADPTRARDLTQFRVNGRIQQSVWESLGDDYDMLKYLVPPECPVLIVHGRDDPIPAASSEQAASAMNAKLVLLDDCGHVPYVEQPSRLFAALDDFLAASSSQ